MLFTKKTAGVPHHKGQFSFPGGVVEQRDGSRVETALREAWEEIRLPAEAVEVLGLLDDTETRATHFVITPGGRHRPRTRSTSRPDGREIERVIEVPLDHAAGPGHLSHRDLGARRRAAPRATSIRCRRTDVIWGATARILKQFLELLDGPEETA